MEPAQQYDSELIYVEACVGDNVISGGSERERVIHSMQIPLSSTLIFLWPGSKRGKKGASQKLLLQSTTLLFPPRLVSPHSNTDLILSACLC